MFADLTTTHCYSGGTSAFPAKPAKPRNQRTCQPTPLRTLGTFTGTDDCCDAVQRRTNQSSNGSKRTCKTSGQLRAQRRRRDTKTPTAMSAWQSHAESLAQQRQFSRISGAAFRRICTSRSIKFLPVVGMSCAALFGTSHSACRYVERWDSSKPSYLARSTVFDRKLPTEGLAAPHTEVQADRAEQAPGSASVRHA